MQFRILGRTGLQVSEVGFGGALVGIRNYLGEYDPSVADDECRSVDAVRRALDVGLNFLDTAPAYGHGLGESIYGKAIAGRRHECILSTKCGPRQPAEIRRSCEESLERLGTDCIDVYQLHGGCYTQDEVTGILERGGLETLEALRTEGKIRYLGFTAEVGNEAATRLVASGRFDVMQIRYNLFYQDNCDLIGRRGIMFAAEAVGMGITLMRPLASGIVGNWMEAVAPGVAAQIDLPRQLLNYVLSNKLVDVAIVGMRRAEEVDENNAISDDASTRLDLPELHHRWMR
ncbi:MAG: aldo/keto reductase [Armatimonadetes bacterium]|nr:aldo/keto reductase [Armatimonadota bacterium]